MNIKSIETFILHVPVTGSHIADSIHSTSHWGVMGARFSADDDLTGFGFTGTHAHLLSDQRQVPATRSLNLVPGNRYQNYSCLCS